MAESKSSNNAVIAVVVVAALVAVAGASVFLCTRCVQGGGIVASLDAETTVSALAVTNPHLRIAEVLDQVGALPESVRKGLEGKLDRPGLTAIIGFDPSTAEGWALAGVDPTGGFAIVLDSRLGVTRHGVTRPAPVLLARVTDSAKLKAWVEKQFNVAVEGDLDSTSAVVISVAGESLIVGRRGDLLAVAPLDKDDIDEGAITKLKGNFGAFLVASGSTLADDESWRKAFADAEDPWLTSWTPMSGVQNAAAAWGGGEADARALLDHVATLVAGAGMRVGPRGLVADLVTSDAGHKALADVLVPDGAAPDCAGLIPRDGWVGARLSIDLANLTTGILAMLPEDLRKEHGSTIQGGPALAAMAAGMSWSDLTAALSGHVCAGVDLASTVTTMMTGGKAAPYWLAVIGIDDPKGADSLLARLANMGRGLLGGDAIAEAEVEGRKGYSVQVMSISAVIVRDGKRFVAGPDSNALQAAFARSAGESLKGTSLGEMLDGPTALGYGLDLRPIVGILQSVGKLAGVFGVDEETAVMQEAVGAALKDLGDDPYARMAVRVTDGSLRFEALGSREVGGGIAAAVVSVAAAVIVPSLTKYTRDAREALEGEDEGENEDAADDW